MTRRQYALRDAAWSFETKRFVVAFYAEHEELDPADSFEFEDDIDAVRNGDVEWFCAIVRVFLKQPDDELLEVGSDVLGACVYNSVREFTERHRDADAMNRNCSVMRAARGGNVSICHYFPSMVAEAVSAALDNLAGMPKLRAQ